MAKTVDELKDIYNRFKLNHPPADIARDHHIFENAVYTYVKKIDQMIVGARPIKNKKYRLLIKTIKGENGVPKPEANGKANGSLPPPAEASQVLKVYQELDAAFEDLKEKMEAVIDFKVERRVKSELGKVAKTSNWVEYLQRKYNHQLL